MTGRTNLEGIKNKGIKDFVNKGIHPQKKERYQDIRELELAFNKPMLKPGRVYFKTSFANENELFLDGHYDIVKSIPTNMYIVK